jgi:hypothetical protein
MHISANSLGAVFVFNVLYLAININAVIHKDSVIKVVDIKSFNENSDTIVKELILRLKILFTVSSMIVTIAICQ